MSDTVTLFEHTDGRYAVAPGTGSPAFTNDDPAWVRLGPVDVSTLASANETRPGDVSTDQLIELTAHLERVRARAIVEATEKVAGENDPATLKPFWSGWSSACEEIVLRLKTEAWGMLSNGGWGPTGAANEDDRPSPEFPELLRRALSAPSIGTSGDQAPSDATAQPIAGQIYETVGWGRVTFVGLDHYCGETTYQLKTAYGARYVKPEQWASTLAAPQLVERKAQSVSDNRREDFERFIVGTLKIPADRDAQGAYVWLDARTSWHAWEAALSQAQSVSDNRAASGVHAQPQHAKCPITGRPYFMTIEHPDLGMVETFGGPFDSYTIPTLEGKETDLWHEREMRCERYDHDLGGWRIEDSEHVPLRLIHEAVLFELQAKADEPPSQAHGRRKAAAYPCLPEREAGAGAQDWYTADQMRAYAEAAVALHADLPTEVDALRFELIEVTEEREFLRAQRPAAPAAEAAVVAVPAKDVTPLLRRLKQSLMRQRLSGPETVSAWARACTNAEGEIEEWLAAAPTSNQGGAA